MQTGKVISFDNQLGYGWIDQGPGKPDMFVHFSCINGEGYKKLEKGDIVSFDVETGPKGKPQATNVTILEKAVA